MGAPRTLALWCPDWPVVAAGNGGGQAGAVGPVAVVDRGVVLACSAAARAAGVERGQRRRQAQARCPHLVVVDHDPGRDARAFEPVVAAVEAFTPTVEIVRPGVCAVPTRGPSRYFGGDEALAAKIAGAAGAIAPGCRTGIAEGRFAAVLAARGGLVVPPGQTAAFLAPLPTTTLEEGTLEEGTLGEGFADLVGLLGRLGVRTLGELAALPPRAVLARFASPGTLAHRLARGLDDRPPAARRPPPDLAVETLLDPPVERAEAVAFAARGLADELTGALAARGLAADRVAIEVETEWGERRCRLWRLEGAGAAALAQRARWQLEAWLTDGGLGPLTRVRLAPDEVRPDRGRQQGFWGGDRMVDDRVAAVLARIQGRWGVEAVVSGVPAGGRGPAEQLRLVPWGGPPVSPESGPGRERPPWPGRVPPPAPATVHPHPVPAEVTDAAGGPVGVSGRGLPTTAPARVSVSGGPWAEVVAWAGPWPLDERWWDPPAHRRRARWQLVTAAGDTHLIALEGGRWWAEALYD